MTDPYAGREPAKTDHQRITGLEVEVRELRAQIESAAGQVGPMPETAGQREITNLKARVSELEAALFGPERDRAAYAENIAQRLRQED